MNCVIIYFKLSVLVSLALFTTITMAIDLPGGSEKNPVDITSYVLTNQNINFTGGYFVVTIPSSGDGIVTPASIDPILIRYGNNGFIAASSPAINYKGTITGNGTLIVRSGFNSTSQPYGQPFTGGIIVFSNVKGQAWGVEGIASGGHARPGLIIEANTGVAFSPSTTVGLAFPSSPDKSRNVVNNGGYLYSAMPNVWASITGTGINVFQFEGGDRGRFSETGFFYSAKAFVFNSGFRIYKGAAFENQPDGQPTTLVSSDITVFQNGVGQWLTIPSSYKIGDEVNLIREDIYMFSLNLQLWGRGIHQFTGTLLPPTASKNHLELATYNDAVKGLYHYGAGSNQAFGRVINLTNRMTFLMGDGSEIVENPDGVTNNVFLQGNPFNSLLSTANFESGPNGDQNQAIAYNYSGAYRINTNMNANVEYNNGNGIVKGIRNGDWVHLLFLNPREWNIKASKPNHAIITAPVFFAGLTRIDRNAILQLGDGTTGNNIIDKVLAVNGYTEKSRYNDSMGNGMLMTKGNEGMLPKGAGRENMNATVKFEIVNNGKLVVNNTPDAYDATTDGASPEVAAWVRANLLDGIAGNGRVDQIGKLPLTLGSATGNPNTYTGGTIIGAESVLIAGSLSAFGSRDAGTGSSSGRVVNGGTLQAAKGVRVINVPGDYVQGKSEATKSDDRIQPRKVFTNNGDGKHDTWWILLKEDILGPVDVAVYTRYGQEVFHSDNYPAVYYEEPAPEDGRTGWDGTYKGQLLPPDAYYYVITVPNEKKVRGAVTILR